MAGNAKSMITFNNKEMGRPKSINVAKYVRDHPTIEIVIRRLNSNRIG